MAKWLLVITTFASLLSNARNATAQIVGDAPRRAIATESLPADEITANNLPATDAVTELLRNGPETLTSPKKLSGSLQIMLLLTVISLAPAILLMTTSFVRIVVVLGLLRQALGTQQLPPSQVMTAIALFMTLLLMAPVWTEAYEQGIQPYTNNEIGL